MEPDSPRPRLPLAWGVDDDTWAEPTEADRRAESGWARLVRAVPVAAPPEEVWPWLCMLRAAPYSYDWVDNLGHRSPRTLDPALSELAVGQGAMRYFEIVGFETGRSITVVPRSRRWGRLLISYDVRPRGAGSLLVGVMRFPHLAAPLLEATAWGDLVMMRKQLRTLARLSAR